MTLVVGLGNPETKYKHTRHNVGFMAVDAVAHDFSFSPWKKNKKCFSLTSEGNIDGKKILLTKPETYMNNSGKAISSLLSYYNIETVELFVIYDDVDLDFGDIRFRESGSSGGHNGIKSIIQLTGTDNFKRIKIGVSNKLKKEKNIRTEKFVLAKFGPIERLKLKKSIIPGVIKTLQEKIN